MGQAIWDQFSEGAPLPVNVLVLGLLIDAVLSAILAWYYVRYGRSLTNRVASSRTLVFVSLTTVLIISVVKSSLALALGLVGALSIVRFRTPIKDPEELAYIFMAIGVGVGLGANQHLATVVAFVVILGVLSVRNLTTRRRRPHNLYLTVDAPEGGEGESTFRRIRDITAEHVEVADLRRMDSRDGRVQATFYVDCEDDSALLAAMDALKAGLPGAAISFVDQEQILAV